MKEFSATFAALLRDICCKQGGALIALPAFSYWGIARRPGHSWPLLFWPVWVLRGAPGPIAELTGSIMGVLGLDSGPIGFGLLLVGLVLLATLMGLIQARIAVKLQTNYVLAWQDDLMRSYLNSHWSFVRGQSTGNLVGSIITETGRLGGAYYQSVLLITVGIHLIIYLTIGFLLSSAICLIVLGWHYFISDC